MKKIFIIIAALSVLGTANAFAQEKCTCEDKTCTVVEETQTPEGKIVTTTTYEKDRVFVNGFWKNWTVAGALGAQMYYGDNDWKVAKWTEQVTFPAIDLYLTKWASPYFGVGLGVSGFKFKGLYQGNPYYGSRANFQTDKAYTGADAKYNCNDLHLQEGNYFNAYVLAHADLGNIFFGYKADRFFDIDAYAGGGIIYGFGDDYNFPGASFNCGLANMFRLSNKLQLMVNLRGALISDDFDGESYLDESEVEGAKANHKLDFNFGITAGLCYKLGKDKEQWQVASRVSEVVYNDKLAAENEARARELAEKLAAANAENEKLLKERVVVKDTPELWFHINFVIDKWDIVKREMINLQSIAEIIKSTPNTKYFICGYADKQTASAEHNVMLSKNRVNAVYETLTGTYGVNPEQLVTDYKGGVDYMFYDEAEFSRCVMINSVKE